MRNFLIAPAMMIVFLASSQSFAGPCPPGSSSGECFEVEAPDLSEGGGIPGTTIGGAISSGGHGIGSATSTSGAAINAKGHQDAQTVKDEKEKESGEVTEESLLDALLQLVHPEIEAARYAMDKLSEIYRFNIEKSWWSETVKRDPKTGVIETTKQGSCISVQIGSGERKPGCSEIRGTKWKDPADGRQKMVITVLDYYEVPKDRPTIFNKYDRKYSHPITFVVEKPEDIYAFFQSI